MEHGFYEPVLPHLQRALELDEKLVASGPDDAEAQYVVGRDYSYLADYYTHVSHWQSALQYHQRALAIDQRLFKVDPKNVNLVERITYDRLGIGEALLNSERVNAAAEQYQAVIDVTLPLTQKGSKGFISDYLGSAYEGMGNVKSWNASHASSQQAKLLSKEGCSYYVKAYPILHGNLWDPDRAKRIEKEISGCRQRP